jgi:hypothetical protein
MFSGKVRVCDAIFCGHLNCAETAFDLIVHGSSLVIGVFLDAFVVALQKRPTSVVNILMLGPPSLTETLLSKIDHPTLEFGLVSVFAENDSKSTEYLVWHIFVCLIGERNIITFPPRRRFDHHLNYPIFSIEQRIVAVNLLVSAAKNERADRYLSEAMVEIFESLVDLDLCFFQIAHYLPASDVLLQRARPYFRNPDVISYLCDRIRPDEMVSILIHVFIDAHSSRFALEEISVHFQSFLGRGEQSVVPHELVQALPFVWNFCLDVHDNTGEIKLALLLDLLTLVDKQTSERSEGWEHFATAVIRPCAETWTFPSQIKFPDEAIDNTSIKRIALLMSSWPSERIESPLNS